MRALRVSPGAGAFLKQYTTNVIEAPRTAFLTREGRTVTAAYQVKISDDETLLAVGAAYVEKLVAHLSRYLPLSETKIDALDDHAVFFDLNAAAEPFVKIEPVGPGARSGASALPSDEDYVRFRIRHFLPEQGIDFTDEMPLSVDERLVRFDKGCYLGQEIVARVHYRGQAPRRLVVRRRGECTAAQAERMTSVVEIEGQLTGFLFI